MLRDYMHHLWPLALIRVEISDYRRTGKIRQFEHFGNIWGKSKINFWKPIHWDSQLIWCYGWHKFYMRKLICTFVIWIKFQIKTDSFYPLLYCVLVTWWRCGGYIRGSFEVTNFTVVALFDIREFNFPIHVINLGGVLRCIPIVKDTYM